MKWENKGHEIEQLAEKASRFDLINGVYVFGAGMLGAYYGMILTGLSLLHGFIDNYLVGETCLNKRIISLDEYIQADSCIPIIICVAEKNYLAIKTQLEEAGMREGVQFIRDTAFVNTILPINQMIKAGEVFIPLCQICVTERCTLKCMKCAHACHMVSQDYSDLSLLEVRQSADSFFRLVDYAGEFVLIGGEPLLYKDLAKAIAYIGKTYGSKMGIFSITTNGTIVPSNEVLEQCHHYDVMLRISNYSSEIPRLKISHEKIIKKLDEYSVKYMLGKEENNWMDYGFEYVDRNHENLEEVFNACSTPCHEVRGDRFYQCVMARTVSENMYHEETEDYLNLAVLEGEEGKRMLLEYSMGFSRKGYLEMCNHCHGAGSKNYPIPVAEQIARGILKDR